MRRSKAALSGRAPLCDCNFATTSDGWAKRFLKRGVAGVHGCATAARQASTSYEGNEVS